MENFTNEIWKDIPEYEGLYQASDLGRVRSLDRYRDTCYNKKAFLKGKILKFRIVKGYYRVCLRNNGAKFIFVHRLVWSAFNGEIPEGMQVNHINEIKTDNRLSNLNLMSRVQNVRWGTGIERRANKIRGVYNTKVSKKVIQYDLDGKYICEYPSVAEACRVLGAKSPNIYYCCKDFSKTCKGYRWKYK